MAAESDEHGEDEWANNRQYGVVIDAGSSGTRLQVYSWLRYDYARTVANGTQLGSLPQISRGDRAGREWQKKLHPGISYYASRPESVVEEHIKPLLDHALRVVPSAAVSTTPVFLQATAGMRLLGRAEREAILSRVCEYIHQHTHFLAPECALHVRVISGLEEGLYGWIALNYLMGSFDERSSERYHGHRTYGFLDMGGASAQIAFRPNASETTKHSKDLQLLRLRNLDGTHREYQVYVSTWLGFGANEARRRYLEQLVQSKGRGASRLIDPCLPLDREETLSGTTTTVIGSGSLEQCLALTEPLISRNAPCWLNSCLVGMHAPRIDFDTNHFVGVSEFWHSSHDAFGLGGAYDYNTYYEKVNQFCSRPWIAIKADLDKGIWSSRVDEEKASMLCFKAAWMMNILHEGFGLPRYQNLNQDNDTFDLSDKGKGFPNHFVTVHKIGDTEVSWTLGKMILWASGNISPNDTATSFDITRAVGFGPNTEEFQQRGQFYTPDGILSLEHTLTGTTGHGGMALARDVGAVVVVFAAAVGLFFWIGRYRRHRLWSVVKHHLFCTRRHPNDRGEYVGVEEGQGRCWEENFKSIEIGDYPRSGTPLGGGEYRRSKSLIPLSSYGRSYAVAETTAVQPHMVRAESRERLTKSREGSPSRLRTTL